MACLVALDPVEIVDEMLVEFLAAVNRCVDVHFVLLRKLGRNSFSSEKIPRI